MKKNKSSQKKSIKKIVNSSKNNLFSSLKLAQLKFKESLKSGSYILRISKEKRYKKIIEKINQFKNNKSLSKNVQKSKTSDSLILELLKKERYKKIIEKINHFKKLGIPSKKDKKSNNIPIEFQLKKLSNNLPLSVSNMNQALGGVVFHIVIIILFAKPYIDFSTTFLIAMSHQIFLVSFGAFTILMFLIKRNSASKTVSIFFLIPPTSALMAWIFLNESLSNLDLLGFLIATIGVYIATRD